MELSKGQQSAYDQIGAWLKTDEKRFVLAGFAGTGKTTIASRLSEQVNGETYFASFTGKAAFNLRKKGTANALTLHKLIYTQKHKSYQRLIELRAELAKQPSDQNLIKAIADENKNLARPAFSLNLNSPVLTSALIIVDEYSMLTDEMVNDLEGMAKKVLYLGDPAQLPPIGSENKLHPNYFLEEIHRHALDSPVLRAATTIRKGGNLTMECQEGFHYGHKNDFTWDDYKYADQVIVGRNDNRKILNNKFRQKYGRTSPYPQITDKIICLKNDHDVGLMNGMIFNTLNNCEDEINDKQSFVLNCEDDEMMFKDLVAWSGTFDGKEISEHAWQVKDKKYKFFDYGYAITVHKSQGSEWENVLIYDDGFRIKDREMRRRWLYTALTRASKGVKIVRAYG